MVSLNELEVNKGHFESQAMVAYIIVKYRSSVFNYENGILKENDLTVTSPQMTSKVKAIVAYIIVKYRNSVFNDENGILKENNLTVTSNDLQGQRPLNRMTFILHSLQYLCNGLWPYLASRPLF